MSYAEVQSLLAQRAEFSKDSPESQKKQLSLVLTCLNIIQKEKLRNKLTRFLFCYNRTTDGGKFINND